MPLGLATVAVIPVALLLAQPPLDATAGGPRALRLAGGVVGFAYFLYARWTVRVERTVGARPPRAIVVRRQRR